MNNELSIIDEREVLGKDFKVYGTFEDPLFLAKDVYKWIEHNNITLMLKNVDEDEKIKLAIMENITPSHGGKRKNTEAWFLTEDGLYEVLMQSRKPIAKQFKKEVKKILKEIRTTGKYEVANNTVDNDVKAAVVDVMKQVIPDMVKETMVAFMKELQPMFTSNATQNTITTSTKEAEITRNNLHDNIMQLSKISQKHPKRVYGELYNGLKEDYGIDLSERTDKGYINFIEENEWSLVTEEFNKLYEYYSSGANLLNVQ